MNKATEAGRNYPPRLCNNILNLHKNISTYSGDRDYKTEPIRSKLFIPNNLTHVSPNYYHLIAYISKYFDCRAIWKKTMVRGTIRPINTFILYGYYQDMLLAYHYITKTINNLNCMRFNLRKEYRRIRINNRRRNIKKKNPLDAQVKATNYWLRWLKRIDGTWESILEGKEPNQDKLEAIDNILYQDKVVSYKNYKYKNKPDISNAYCRKGKFINKRVIN